MPNTGTLYHMMDEAGVFKRNPANVQSMDDQNRPAYRGPVEFPVMLYHPTGETRITQEAELIATPFGPKKVNEQRELIHEIARDQGELEALLEKGWKRHPLTALTGEEQPLDEMGRMKAEMARMKAELEELQGGEAKPEAPAPRAPSVMPQYGKAGG